MFVELYASQLSIIASFFGVLGSVISIVAAIYVIKSIQDDRKGDRD